MIITVRTNFAPTERQIETQSITLGTLLEGLSRNYEGSVGIIDAEHGGVNPYFLVLLNGQSYHALNDGIATKLQDGDIVSVYGSFLIVGG